MSESQEWLVRDPTGTQHLAATIGRNAHPGLVIGLVGDLGAGKTTFVQGLAQGLGVPPDVAVTSPTFALVQRYEGGRLPLIHVDAYRISAAKELPMIGLDDWFTEAGVVAIEWADRIADSLPSWTLWCHIEHASPVTRHMIFSCPEGLQNNGLHSILCGAADSELATVVHAKPKEPA